MLHQQESALLCYKLNQIGKWAQMAFRSALPGGEFVATMDFWIMEIMTNLCKFKFMS
jgi:hypothetical protein